MNLLQDRAEGPSWMLTNALSRVGQGGGASQPLHLQDGVAGGALREGVAGPDPSPNPMVTCSTSVHP